MPFFVSGLYKFMGKLAGRIFFGVQGPRGLGLGCRSLCLAFKNFMGKLADRIFSRCPGPTGVRFGVLFFVSGLYKFMRKLADRVFLVSRAHGAWVWGAVLCVWPLKIYGKTSR